MSETTASSTSTDNQSITYYNTSTHATKTKEEMIADGWLELSEERYGDKYQYPALYNTTTHDVLDMTEGDKSGDWMVISSESESSSSSDTSTSSTSDESSSSSDTSTSSTSDDSTDSSAISYYNKSTHAIKTKEEMIADGWLELSEERYGDKYQYPALYNTTTHDVLDMTDGDKSGDWVVLSSNNTAKVGTTNNDYTADSKALSSIAGSAPVTITAYESGKETTLDSIKDYDGNLHGGDNSEGVSSAYKYHGMLDVNGDGIYETIFTNKISQRWVTAEVDTTLGKINFERHGTGGGTRVVGIYEDPLIAEGSNNGGFLSDGKTLAPANVGVSDEDRYVEVSSLTYYNTSTHSTKTKEEMIADGWLELSEERYGDEYQYPALYNMTTHDVLDMTEGDKSGDWMAISSKETVDRLALNSEVRFQNDLEIDNLTAKTAGDYDSDGIHEVYWKTNDGTAYLRALMHDDGNIRYANYQSESQMSDYLTAQGHESVIAEII